jgi:hypothetical protein
MKSHSLRLPAALLPLLLGILPACRTASVAPPPAPPASPAATEAAGTGDEVPPPAPAPSPTATPPAALHILRWNPAISSFTEETFREGVDRLANDGTALTSWSLHDWESVRPGDWALFARVGGEEPSTDGIAGICRIASMPYEALSWRGDGSTAHYAEIDLRLLNDPAATGVLAAPELDALFPSVDWHGGHSGVPVPPGTAAPLALVVADRLAAAGSAGYPSGSLVAAENGLALEFLPYRLVGGLCPGLRAVPPTSSGGGPAAPFRVALDWPTPFDPNDTHPSTFHAPSGDVTVPFMNRDTAAVRKTLSPTGWTALVLPAAGDAFELLLLVPPRGATPGDIESALPEALAAERTAAGHSVPVFLSLPKTTLVATGPVLRSTRLDLDEGSPSGLPPSTPLPAPSATAKPVRVLLNRPFVVALRDTQTSSFLLLGTVLSP